ncbi:choice-of-anchor A family protein [Winogradskyella litoriviva]|uniref:Choice-of-anchor A family protein n=1 Tax=Winogradskyella litoriviva TaxID=1220182 RepID=A0ABX2E5G6_9FLAO|nr:collagen-binding domain-containing protein [Winogradskyella litoriviva]NRD23637.1 choice-of-anchor A family protein [Winogradskyella litoriviva]
MEIKKLLFSLVIGCSYLNVTSYLEAQSNPVNPTEAATNFNIFTSGDAIAIKTETEGSWAVGGDFILDGTINIFGGVNYYNQDTQPTALVVAGKINYNSGQLQILQNNFIKIGDLSTSSIFEVDQNNVVSNTRITANGANYDSTPRIALATQQTANSIAEDPQVDFSSAFVEFISISNYLGTLTTNTTWTASEFNYGKLWIDLTPNETNVINLTVAEFNALSEIKFNNQVPSTDIPFVINITDSNDSSEVIIDSWPNIVGNPLSYAPYILINFPDITSTINYVGGAQVYGTIYAPEARFNNRSNFNIDGQIIVEKFEQNSGEVHPYIFDSTIDIPDDSTPVEICDGIDNNGDGVIDEGFADTDGDGVADCIDNCVDSYNPNQVDEDGNGIGDACEIQEAVEICDGIDNNGDGVIDEGFTDTDGDGIADCIDNCVDTHNPDQVDEDGNGIGDSCEAQELEWFCDGVDNDGDGLIDEGYTDTDGDGVADCIDNCLETFNPDQLDENNNYIGDVCEGFFEDAGRAALSLELYPVPFKGIINLSYTSNIDTTATIEIFDIHGSLLKTVDNFVDKNANIIKLDLTDIELGSQVLFVRFKTSEGTIYKKIISK